MILKELGKRLESEQSDKRIFDIVIYGSSMKGKAMPNDIDIVVIFLSGTLRERLEKMHQIKEKIKGLPDIKLDMKQILLQELFSAAFMARKGILFEGYSSFNRKLFAETLGFKPYALFYYSLKGLSHTQKVKFNYALAGRNSRGIIEIMEGKRLARGAVKIPPGYSSDFEYFLKSYNVNFRKENILEETY